MIKKKVILVGTGYMAQEYLKVLAALDCEITLIGRNEEKLAQLTGKYPVKRSYGWSVGTLADMDCKDIDLGIIASSVDSLKEVSCACIAGGINNLLVEKPGALNLSELLEIKKKLVSGVFLRIAYNRRFYNSVLQLKNRIGQDGGALACFFDFTERQDDIFLNLKPKEVVNKWGFANSSHVIDAAFYLIGLPVEFNSFRSGSWELHPSGNVFAGSGKTNSSLFSYFATWAGGGRWNIEVSTPAGRYRLCPLEELYFSRKNQVAWERLEPQDDDDRKFKPGLYKMVRSVLCENNPANLPDIDAQIKFCALVNTIFGYAD